MKFTENWGEKIQSGRLYIDPLPGSTKIAVIHGTFVESDYRGIGIGERLQRRALEWAKREGFTYVLCTTRLNGKQDARLPTLGWTPFQYVATWSLWVKKI